MPALCTPARGDALHTGILLAPGGVMYSATWSVLPQGLYCHMVCTVTGSVALCTSARGDALHTGILLAPGGDMYSATWSVLSQGL